MWAKAHRVDVLTVGKDLCADVDGKGNHIASSVMNLTWNKLGWSEFEGKVRRLILRDVTHDSSVQLIKNECGRDRFQVIPVGTEEQCRLAACIARCNFRRRFGTTLAQTPEAAPL